MADQLTGRAIDEACCSVMRWEHPLGLPPTVAEMFEWLEVNANLPIELRREKDGWDAWANWSREQFGTTLREALARLVVEVARARGSK